jgi:hypothetical protein
LSGEPLGKPPVALTAASGRRQLSKWRRVNVQPAPQPDYTRGAVRPNVPAPVFQPEFEPAPQFWQIEVPDFVLAARTREPHPPDARHRQIRDEPDLALLLRQLDHDRGPSPSPQASHGYAAHLDSGGRACAQSAGSLEEPHVETGPIFHEFLRRERRAVVGVIGDREHAAKVKRRSPAPASQPPGAFRSCSAQSAITLRMGSIRLAF